MQPPVVAPVHIPQPTLLPLLIDASTARTADFASLFLTNDAWVANASRAFASIVDSPNRDGIRANVLAQILDRRLHKHLLTKVANPSKLTHPAWDFVRDNIANVAALIVLQGHARMDMESANGRSSLLRDPSAFPECATGPISAAQGAYLYYDNVSRVFIRAGKTNVSFATRHTEHSKAAELKRLEDISSLFYR